MAFLGQEEQVREFQERFKYLYVALTIGLLILLMRLVYLQILSGDRMRQYSEENRIKRVKIAAPRGMIYDRHRNLLVDNRPAFDLEIIPQYLKESKQQDQVIRLLAKLIKVKESDIHDILNKAKGQASFLPVKIKMDLTRDEVARVETWQIDLPGVEITEEIKRTNLYHDVAAHLLGYIGEVNQNELPTLNKKGLKYKLGDVIGKFGLEQRLEDTLRGSDGEKLVEVDALGRIKIEKGRGRIIDQQNEKSATPGKNLILTIDQDLQLMAKEAFAEKNGGVVAMDPSTGEILAMVSKPSFDPTEFSRGITAELWNSLINNENRPLRDKTIQDHYSPGSVFKVVTAIAGLEEGEVDEHTVFNCPGVYKLGNRTYHCWQKGGHGNVNLREALSKSCDVYFWKLAQRLKSVDQIAKWATYLGLGKKTGINLAREIPGLIPTEAWKQKRFNQEWTPGETLSVAIGQSFVLTTVIQLATVYSSIANGGTLFRPQLVKEIETADGEIIKKMTPEIIDRHELKDKTKELIRAGLFSVVNDTRGTAYAQRLPGMDFAGKTGTVQVIRIAAEKIYAKCTNMRYRDRHHGVFAGFAPAHNPKIAVAVVAEHSCSGSSGAAPIARAVVKKYLEKHFPDQFSETVLAARLKAEGKNIYVPNKERTAPVIEDVSLGVEDSIPYLPSTENPPPTGVDTPTPRLKEGTPNP